MAFIRRQTLIARPFIIPPKIVISNISSVIAYPGIISTKNPTSNITQQEKSVNFFPINLKPIYTGMAFNIIFTTVYGNFTLKNIREDLVISKVIPVAPPGNKSPVLTKVLILTAIKAAAKVITTNLFISFFIMLFLLFFILSSIKLSHKT